MKHFLLFYTTADDYLERRGEFRSDHLRLAWEYQERGDLVLAGALADPPGRCGADVPGRRPFGRRALRRGRVSNGLVTRWYVREWTTVVGELAAHPVQPD